MKILVDMRKKLIAFVNIFFRGIFLHMGAECEWTKGFFEKKTRREKFILWKDIKKGKKLKTLPEKNWKTLLPLKKLASLWIIN